MESEPQYSLEPELKQPLPRVARIDPGYAFRQMLRVTIITVTTSLLWTGLNLVTSWQYSALAPPAQPHTLEEFVRDNHGLIALAAATLIGLSALLWIMVFLETMRRSRLVISGAATAGAVTAKRVALGKDGAFTQITYRFLSPDGRPLLGSVDCDWNSWSAVKVGAPVTVLFDPAHPANNVLYRYCGFRAS